MKSSSTSKYKFDCENNPALFDLVKDILRNNLSQISSFQAWRGHFTKYIDPEIVHRKKDVTEFEKKFNADFFEILFAIHLIVYLLGKELIGDVNVPNHLKKDLQEALFEDAVAQFSKELNQSIVTGVKDEYKTFKGDKTKHAYDLFEHIYRNIAPKEIRKPLGEYFTPLSLAKRMVSSVDQKYENGVWMDNSSGFGVFLFAYLDRFGIEKIDNFVCIEVNPLSVFITKVSIINEFRVHLTGINFLPIYWGDALLNERYQYENGCIKANGNFACFYDNISVIIGNPPWVSWKSMTKHYQNLIGNDWRSYDIFEKNITRKTLGACNDDISSYFVYHSIDKFLKETCLLKFVINLSLFKSNLSGKQFRLFYIKKNNTPFKITSIEDLSNYKIFQGVTNSYCIFDAIKGERTIYPIQYSMIYAKKDGSDEQIIETTARPANNVDGGALITVNGNEEHFNSIEGLCEYKARAGVCTWLNSVYWVRKISTEGHSMRVANLSTCGKKKLKEVDVEIEKDLVFRLLRARNLNDFEPVIENYIVVPQQIENFSKPIPEDVMLKKYNNALNFFLNFKDELVERSGYKKFLNGQPFYGLYNIGSYTKAPIKLGWQFISKRFQVYLIDNAEDIIPDLNVMFIPLEDIDEAFYLHALLNSKYATKKIESSSNWTFPSGSIQKVYLERYNPKDALHSRISAIQKSILLKQDDANKRELDDLFKEYWFNGRKKKTMMNQPSFSLV